MSPHCDLDLDGHKTNLTILMMMHHHTKFGYKKSFSSEDVQTFNEDLNLHYDLDSEHSKEVQKLNTNHILII